MIHIKRIPVTPMETNCFIIRDEATGRCAIIDPGALNKALSAAIEEAGYDSFDYILLTHCHFDHVGGVSRVKQLTGAPVAIHAADAPGLRDPYVNLSGTMGGCKTIYSPADILFTDGQTFRLGETEFTVLHTPGHTLGSVCYRIGDALFTGDTMFRASYGRTDFPGGDEAELFRSLRRLLKLEKDYIVCPGHGMPTTRTDYLRIYSFFHNFRNINTFDRTARCLP